MNPHLWTLLIVWVIFTVLFLWVCRAFTVTHRTDARTWAELGEDSDGQ